MRVCSGSKMLKGALRHKRLEALGQATATAVAVKAYRNGPEAMDASTSSPPRHLSSPSSSSPRACKSAGMCSQRTCCNAHQHAPGAGVELQCLSSPRLNVVRSMDIKVTQQ
jgi:hypothetical protein